MFCYTITTYLFGLRIRIITTILLFSIAILLLMKRPLRALVSITWKDLLSYYCISSVKIRTDVN